MLEWIVTNTPLVFFTQDIWRDEAFSYLITQKPFLDMLLLTAQDFSPPLYYVLLKIWIAIFGGSELMMRMPSLLFFWGTVYGCCLILERVCNLSPRTSSIISLFVALNPLLVYYAAEARGYTMLTFFTVWSFYLFLQRSCWWYVLITVLGLYTHYFMVFVPFVQIVWLFLTKHAQKHMFTWIRTFIIVGMLFAPWVLFTFSVKTFTGDFWIAKPGLHDLVYAPTMIYTGFHHEEWFFKETFYPFIFNVYTLGVVMYAFLIGGFIFMRTHIKKHDRNLLLLFVLWALGIPLVVFLLAAIRSLYYPRYLILATPGFVLLLGFLTTQFPRRLQVLILIIFAIITGYYLHLEIQYKTKAEISSTVQIVKPLLHEDDRVYTTSELQFHVLQYYFGEEHVFIYNIPYENIPYYVGKVLIPKEHTTFELPQYPAKAYIFNGGSTYTIKSWQ